MSHKELRLSGHRVEPFADKIARHKITRRRAPLIAHRSDQVFASDISSCQHARWQRRTLGKRDAFR